MNSPIYQGNFLTTKKSTTIYSMDIYVIDAYGNNIVGTYFGSLNFYNATSSAAPAASIKGWSEIKQLEQTTSLFNIKN